MCFVHINICICTVCKSAVFLAAFFSAANPPTFLRKEPFGADMTSSLGALGIDVGFYQQKGVWKDDFLGCDIGGAKELRVIYFPTNWGAKEPQNLPNHRVVFLFAWVIV